jgi:hypothetical protein
LKAFASIGASVAIVAFIVVLAVASARRERAHLLEELTLATRR